MEGGANFVGFDKAPTDTGALLLLQCLSAVGVKAFLGLQRSGAALFRHNRLGGSLSKTWPDKMGGACAKAKELPSEPASALSNGAASPPGASRENGALRGDQMKSLTAKSQEQVQPVMPTVSSSDFSATDPPPGTVGMAAGSTSTSALKAVAIESVTDSPVAATVQALSLIHI